MENPFTSQIQKILSDIFGDDSNRIFEASELIKYINLKTKSANRGSKSRGSFANLYAIYVLIEDYINKGFIDNNDYKDYEGAVFTDLMRRQRELPFGQRLQNHALNNRVNSEFKKYFPLSGYVPILRNQETSRYWINENLLKVEVNDHTYNLATAIIQIIKKYVEIKLDSMNRFIIKCEELQAIENKDTVLEHVHKFISDLLAPNIDARLFEIVSFSILKYYYKGQSIFWGFSLDKISEEELKLYKTGRTNANDGGIDFVMKPLGRFFQVTETLDFKKYFLDIDKIERYPITFVVKSLESEEDLKAKIYKDAIQKYVITDIVNKYMDCIEEIINIPKLQSYLTELEKKDLHKDILNEIIIQSKVEYNYDEEDNED